MKECEAAIKIIREKRQDAERKIANFLANTVTEFTAETGLLVQNVDVDILLYGSKYHSHISNVSLKLEDL